MENTRLFQKDVNKIMSSNMHNWLTFVYTVAAQFPSLDYSHDWIPLFWFAEEYVRANVTRHTNDEYELFTRVHTSKCVVTFVLRFAAAS